MSISLDPEVATPSYEQDLFSDEAIREPHAHYAAIRALGSVVWLSQHGVYAIGRYHDVRAALADHEVFSSAQGIGLNEIS